MFALFSLSNPKRY